MPISQNLIPLRGFFQSYTWGDDSEHSFIRKLWADDPLLPKNGPIAEMWLGNHANGKSLVQDLNTWITLEEFLSKSNLKGPKFLAKILCIKNVLSIQLHPSDEQAKILNRENPIIFPDTNSKPEMAIALTPLKLLCGVRNKTKILELLNSHLAFDLIRDVLKTSVNRSVKDLFKSVFNLKEAELEIFANAILENKFNSNHDILAKKIIDSGTKLDPGLVALYFLEFHEIPAGQAIYIKPQVPHAYIEGTAFECMKNSDNVVRGGLTSKPIDIDNFCKLVDTSAYDPKFIGANSVIETKNISHTKYQNDDLPFLLEQYEFDGLEQLTLETTSKNEIFITLEGHGSFKLLSSENSPEYSVKPGSSFFGYEKSNLRISGSNLKFIRIIDL